MSRSTFGVAGLCLSIATAVAVAQGLDSRIATTMTPDLVDEAITAGQRDQVPDGGLRGCCLHVSTPFIRVATAARTAKREYRPFTAADVTADMVRPEFDVYATAVPIDGSIANVKAIVITPRKGRDDAKRAAAIQPLAFEDLSGQFKNLFGATFDGTGRMATFPLTVISAENEIHVVYDRPTYQCVDCAVRFDIKRLR